MGTLYATTRFWKYFDKGCWTNFPTLLIRNIDLFMILNISKRRARHLLRHFVLRICRLCNLFPFLSFHHARAVWPDGKLWASPTHTHICQLFITHLRKRFLICGTEHQQQRGGAHHLYKIHFIYTVTIYTMRIFEFMLIKDISELLRYVFAYRLYTYITVVYCMFFFPRKILYSYTCKCFFQKKVHFHLLKCFNAYAYICTVPARKF